MTATTRTTDGLWHVWRHPDGRVELRAGWEDENLHVAWFDHFADAESVADLHNRRRGLIESSEAYSEAVRALSEVTGGLPLSTTLACLIQSGWLVPASRLAAETAEVERLREKFTDIAERVEEWAREDGGASSTLLAKWHHDLIAARDGKPLIGKYGESPPPLLARKLAAEARLAAETERADKWYQRATEERRARLTETERADVAEAAIAAVRVICVRLREEADSDPVQDGHTAMQRFAVARVEMTLTEATG